MKNEEFHVGAWKTNFPQDSSFIILNSSFFKRFIILNSSLKRNYV